jgi:hypothetical protein
MPDAKVAAPATTATGPPPREEEGTRAGLQSIVKTVAMFFALQFG